MRCYRLLTVLLLLCLCLGGCGRHTETPPLASGGGTVESGAPAAEPDREQLAETAKVLTQAVVRCTSGFPEGPLTPPSAPPEGEGPGRVPSFLCTVIYFQSQGCPGSLYAGEFYRDSELMYHLAEDAGPRVLEEVLGIPDWDMSTMGFEHDQAAGEYLTGLEFGLGGSWDYGEIGEVTVEDGRVTVECQAVPLFPEEVEYCPCRCVYTVEQTGDRFFLRLEKVEVG